MAEAKMRRRALGVVFLLVLAGLGYFLWQEKEQPRVTTPKATPASQTSQTISSNRLSTPPIEVQTPEKANPPDYLPAPGVDLFLTASRATVEIDGKAEALAPNEVGAFPPVRVKARSTVPVTVRIPALKPGAPVQVMAMDGGKLDQGTIGQVGAVNDQSEISFKYELPDGDGTHRVTLLSDVSADPIHLEFWVGEDFPRPLK